MRKKILILQIFIAVLISIGLFIPTGIVSGYSPDILYQQLEATYRSSHNAVPYYSQCNGYWGSTPLGRCDYTMCSKGCAVSAVAMAFSFYDVNVDPGTLNRWLTSHCGYQYYDKETEVWRCGGCEIVWETAANYTSKVDYAGAYGRNWVKLRRELDQGHPVILDVGWHFVLATGYEQDADGYTYYLNDSGYEAQTLSAYGNSFRRMFVFHPVRPTTNNAGLTSSFTLTTPVN
jgi:hypothetical protein